MPTRSHASAAQAAPTAAIPTALNAATVDALDAEKRRLDATFAWFHDTFHHQHLSASPQQQVQHAIDAGFAGARLALEHAEERAKAWAEHQQRVEQLTLSPLGLSPEHVRSWQQQWFDGQRQIVTHGASVAQRWWDQAKDQAQAFTKATARNA